MSRAGPSDAELTAYAAGRWPAVVRSLVMLGAPPHHAGDLAVEVVERLLGEVAREPVADLDVALAASVVEAWEQDRTAWWQGSVPAGAGLLEGSEVLDRLDRLDPSVRARAVLAVVAGLTDDQLDDVLGPAPRPDVDVAGLALLAGAVEVRAERTDEARRRAGERRRRVRVRAVAGVAAGAVLVATTVALALAVTGPGSGDGPSGGAAGAVTPASAGRDLTPTPWYDGRSVHVGERSVGVPGVRSMVRVGGGVAVLDRRGQVALLGTAGALQPLGTAVGDLAADPASGLVVWIDRTSGALVLHRVGGAHRLVAVTAGSRVVAVADDEVYLDSPAGASRVEADADTPRQVSRGQDDLLDVAAGTTVSTGGEASVLLRTGPGRVQLLPGRDGRLSDDGTLLLTRDVGSTALPPSVVVHVGTGTVVELPLAAGAVVLDAAFGPDGSVTFVLARANGDDYPADWPRDGAYQPGYDLVVCDTVSGACQQDAQLAATDAAPLLAR